MEIERAKSELMQIYGMLSPDKQRAIDTLVKIEPCEDAIPRTTAINLVNDVQNNRGFKNYKYYEYLYDHLSTLPSVNPQEPKIGRWIYIGNKDIKHSMKIVECDSCHKRNYGSSDYCPNCGAKME